MFGKIQTLKKYCGFLLLAAIFGCTDMSSITNQYRDLSYANDSKAQQMDIFIPEGEGPFPAIILIHGGGFKFGDKKADYALAKTLVANGYVAVPVNYRLSGEAVFPAALHDVKAATRYLKANAHKYSIDANNIGTWGSSAGGNLSAMMGTSSGDDFADGSVGDYVSQSTEIQACVDWFGPIDFAAMIQDAKELGFRDNFDVEIESAYIGADASDPVNSPLVQKANPTSYIDENDPPFYIQVGDEDPLIPYLQSKNFAAALRKALGENKIEFEIIEGGGHGGSKFNTEENINKIITFLDKHLK